MTADPAPEQVAEALAWLAHHASEAGPTLGQVRNQWDIVRAALARDVPAGRDLTAQDIEYALSQTRLSGYIADRLNRIARPARDVPAPGGERTTVRYELHLPEDAPEDVVVGRLRLLKSRYERLSAAAGHVVPGDNDAH